MKKLLVIACLFFVASPALADGCKCCPCCKPQTVKVAGRTWAIAIFDTSKQTSLSSGQLSIYGSKTISASVKSAGAIWRRYEVSATIPDSSGFQKPLTSIVWGDAAVKNGLPAMVIIDSAGSVIKVANLPANEAGVLAAVKGVTGAGK